MSSATLFAIIFAIALVIIVISWCAEYASEIISEFRWKCIKWRIRYLRARRQKALTTLNKLSTYVHCVSIPTVAYRPHHGSHRKIA